MGHGCASSIPYLVFVDILLVQKEGTAESGRAHVLPKHLLLSLSETDEHIGWDGLTQCSIFMCYEAASEAVQKQSRSACWSQAGGKDFAGEFGLAHSLLLCYRAARGRQVDFFSIWRAAGKGQMSGWCQLLYAFGNIQVLYWIKTLIGWFLIMLHTWKNSPFY